MPAVHATRPETKPSALLWAPLIALQFLTRLPISGVPVSAYESEACRRQSLIYFPVVGALVGLAAGAAALLCRRLGLPELVSGVVAVAVAAALTGGLHEDGAADVFDSLGAHTREKALQIMRDSRIGAFGAIALWTILTLKAVAISSMPEAFLLRIVVCAHILSRWSSLPLALALKNARSETGLGARFAEPLTWRELLIATVIAWGASLVLLGATPFFTPAPNPVPAVKMALAASACILVTGAFYERRFGGITGDCLGATNQIVEVAVLLLALVPWFWA